ncbi:hypothetical protein KVR01_009421 [Diaporthe batatas]|uniref:uncharacterized protein n=1 Tax=Diaporthe batatas TaxID=748121 RepID=UPI001D04B160|nr:uncharacterized protein KVR01_009421 [Diaporthe batatas]KAG8161157.1 hypothetical protein KVR01_009421 [Diaporthe batatas]
MRSWTQQHRGVALGRATGAIDASCTPLGRPQDRVSQMSHCVNAGLPATRPTSLHTPREVEIPGRSEQLMMQIPPVSPSALFAESRMAHGGLACRTNSDPGSILHVADRQGCTRAASAQSFL